MRNAAVLALLIVAVPARSEAPAWFTPVRSTCKELQDAGFLGESPETYAFFVGLQYGGFIATEFTSRAFVNSLDDLVKANDEASKLLAGIGGMILDGVSGTARELSHRVKAQCALTPDWDLARVMHERVSVERLSAAGHSIEGSKE